LGNGSPAQLRQPVSASTASAMPVGRYWDLER